MQASAGASRRIEGGEGSRFVVLLNVHQRWRWLHRRWWRNFFPSAKGHAGSDEVAVAPPGRSDGRC